MAHSLLMDNWTVQNAGELLCDGLGGDTAHELVIPQAANSFRYAEISEDVVRFDALCQLLTNVVFADHLLVDAAYAYTWSDLSRIKPLATEGILTPKAFLDVSDQWIIGREIIADELCVNAALLKMHRANKRSYAAKRESRDPMLAQLIWGGAGMLARSAHFGLPYVPHPLRTQLFQRTRLLSLSLCAADSVKDFITAQRLKMSERLDGGGFVARLSLPAVAVLIIQESQDLSDLIHVALQVRRDFRSLRQWLAKFQMALDAEDTKEVLSHRKKLESVARNVDSLITSIPGGDTSVQFGFGWLKLGTKVGSPLNTIQNQFGVRGELNRLILAPTGRKALKKFLRMLGEERTSRGLAFQKDILRRSEASATP